ncbi:MAG: molybdopterin molybdotransferase MoeA [Sandaracinaceae bacterium]|nr:molybdopterin molybdotransferase MoeA [Sandaracinaceae bacterium]
MLTIEEAIARILSACRTTEVANVGLHDALGLCLAEDVVAPYGLPEFANSVMDGYAACAADLAGASAATEKALPLIGESRAGATPAALTPGTTMRIFTGAPIPQGADAVVMQEDVRVANQHVHFKDAPRSLAFVRMQGSDVAQGATVLRAGAMVHAGEIGLLASLGFSRVPVHKRPRVAILSTGDELRDVESERRPFTVVNSNAYALAALVREADAEPWVLPRVADDAEAIAEQIRIGLSADLLLSSGGVSVGDYDMVQDAYKRAHVSLDFWRVAMKPGKPLMFGKGGADGRTPVLGLPGNPASAMVTFELFARPAIRTMLGTATPMRPRVLVELTHSHSHAEGRVELARASLDLGDPYLRATLRENQTSGALSSMVGTDALVILPAEDKSFQEGQILEALMIRPPNSAQFRR